MKKIISFVIRYIPRKYLQVLSPIALRVLGFFYAGKGVQCPVCDKEFKKFLPYGRGASARENALCPNCQTLERHRLIWLYLKEKTNFFSQKLRVLHIAPENCFIKPFSKLQNLTYTTADLESPLAMVKMDIQKMPFADNSFDVVLCNHVLEHIPDDYKALSEIQRVLSPKGWAILQIPFFDLDLEKTFQDDSITSPQDRFKAYGQEDHVRMYGKDYPQRIASVGFEVEENNFVKEILPENIKKYALPSTEVLYIARKKVAP